MYFLIYVSSESVPFSEQDLKSLLKLSRANNAELGITGMLLYSEGSFIQAIEGEKQVINTLYAKIISDPRHKGFIRLLDGEIKERNFPEWSMGFQTVSKDEFSEISGYKALSGSLFADSTRPSHPSLVFLKNFVRINSSQARYS